MDTRSHEFLADLGSTTSYGQHLSCGTAAFFPGSRSFGALVFRCQRNQDTRPFPTQQILFHDQTEETDGDRVHQREGWPAGKREVSTSRSIGGAVSKPIEACSLQDNGQKNVRNIE